MKKFILFLLILLTVGGIVGGSIYYSKLIPSKAVIAYSDELYLIIEEDEVDREDAVLFFEDVLYFSYDVIEYYIDNDIYFDDLEDTLIITNEDRVLRYNLDNELASVNNKEFITNNPIKKFNYNIYIPIDIILATYELDINYFE